MYFIENFDVKSQFYSIYHCCRIKYNTAERPLDCKEIKPVNLKGNQSWIFIGRTDDEAEVPTPWPPDAKSQLITKGLDAGKDWGQEEKGTTEDKVLGWHHELNGHEFEQAPADGKGQGSLACCSSWGHKESDTTERLNWNEFPLGLTGLISLLSKGLSRVSSNTTVQKHQFFSTQPSLWSKSQIHTWLQEKSQLWLYGPLSAKWCVCFLIHCLGLA